MIKTMPTKRFNARRLWINTFGKIPPGYEVHHKLPVRLGGAEDVSNYELVTPTEHSSRHFELYEKHNDIRDLCASHMIGNNFTEAHRVVCAAGGKKVVLSQDTRAAEFLGQRTSVGSGLAWGAAPPKVHCAIRE